MTDPSSISNKPGFLMSIIKRHKMGRSATLGVAISAENSKAIIDTLQEYHAAGKLDMTEFDGAILRDLETLPHSAAVKAIESYMVADHTHIRNRCGFMKGIINLLRKDPSSVAAAGHSISASEGFLPPPPPSTV